MRYETKKTGENTWSVYDNIRKCSIVKSLTPNAAYNKEICYKIVNLLNKEEKP